MRRYYIIYWLAALSVVACNGEIYVRDGVTDGDTFFLSPQGMTSSDPAVQSWVSYSLGRSACQLNQESDNPARASSFQCELRARRLLLDSWQERKRIGVEPEDPYLDELERVQTAGYLREYVARYFTRRHWAVPIDLQVDSFADWSDKNLPGHKPQTKLTGSWVYAKPIVDVSKY